MKNIFMMAAVCFVAFSCNRAAMPSISPYTNNEIKNEQGKTILAGHCSVNILETNPYKEWFDHSFNSYVVDSSLVRQAEPYLKNKVIEIFLGSWCGDSKREVPHMIKILQAVNFDTANLKLIFVDNSTKTYKQSPQHEEQGKNIHHVPTFIIYENKKELGRIIENPVISLEKDLLAIVTKQAYIPGYRAIAYWQQHVSQRKKTFSDSALAALATTLKPLCQSMGEFNAYGYVLLAQKNYTEAINIFKLNTFIYPLNAGTFDSLGEAYLTVGNKSKAQKNYKKVLELKPGDENAIKMLKEIQ